MKQRITDTLKNFAYSYALAGVLFIIISFVLKRRLNIDIAYLKANIGAVLVSALLTLSVALFRMKKGPAIVKTFLGFLALLPSVFVTRWVFGVAVFRYSYIVYLFALLCAVIYSIAVIIVASRARKEIALLNALLANKKTEREEGDGIESAGSSVARAVEEDCDLIEEIGYENRKLEEEAERQNGGHDSD